MTRAGPAAVPPRSLIVVVGVVVALSVVHHADHVVRGVTGWPFAGGPNAFTLSLAIYPVIAAGLVLLRLGRIGVRFWAVLSSGGALFVLAVHVGPVAGDSVTDIGRGHASSAAGIAAVVELWLLVLALFVAAAHDHRAWRRAKASG